MADFGFNNITPASQADITKVMENFTKINTLGITNAEAETKIATAKAEANAATDTKLQNYTPTSGLGGLATRNYSYGTDAPTGGTDGDIYDQYFD